MRVVVVACNDCLIGVANYCRCKSNCLEEETACTLSVSLNHALAGLRVAAHCLI